VVGLVSTQGLKHDQDIDLKRREAWHDPYQKFYEAKEVFAIM
jgi:hypothetical protein